MCRRLLHGSTFFFHGHEGDFVKKCASNTVSLKSEERTENYELGINDEKYVPRNHRNSHCVSGERGKMHCIEIVLQISIKIKEKPVRDDSIAFEDHSFRLKFNRKMGLK